MSQPTDGSNKPDKISETTNRNDHRSAPMQEARIATDAFFQEAQKDWQRCSRWIQQHPREEGIVVGGALVVTGVMLGLRNAKIGEAIVVEGQHVSSGVRICETTAAKGQQLISGAKISEMTSTDVEQFLSHAGKNEAMASEKLGMTGYIIPIDSDFDRLYLTGGTQSENAPLYANLSRTLSERLAAGNRKQLASPWWLYKKYSNK